MSQRDRTTRGQSPSESENIVALRPHALEPAPRSGPDALNAPEGFARVLKDALDRVSPTGSRPKPSWDELPRLTDLVGGLGPHGEAAPFGPPPAPDVDGTGVPRIDPGTSRPVLGNLLASGPSVPDDSTSEEDAHPGNALRAVPPEAVYGATPDLALVGGSPGREDPRSPGYVAQGPGRVPGPEPLVAASASSGGSKPGEIDPRPHMPAQLVTQPAGRGDGEFMPSDVPASGPEAGLWSGVQDHVIDMPAANPLAGRMSPSWESLDSGSDPEEGSAYSIDVRETSLSSTAFGPFLSGPGASDGGASARPDTAGVADPVQSVSGTAPRLGIASSETEDRAGGGSIDLSRTNELLLQLLDEMRRSRQPFLPMNDRNPRPF